MKPFVKGIIAILLGIVIGILLYIIIKYWGFIR